MIAFRRSIDIASTRGTTAVSHIVFTVDRDSVRNCWTPVLVLPDDIPATYQGRWWRTEGAFVAPKPVNRSVVMVNAGSSPAGIDYATSQSDIIFVTSSGGADPAEGIVRLTELELADQRRSRLSRGELTPFNERGSAVLLEDTSAVVNRTGFAGGSNS